MSRLTPEGGSVPVNANSKREAVSIALTSSWQPMTAVACTTDGGKPVLLIFSFIIKNDSLVPHEYSARVMMDGFQLGDTILCRLNNSVPVGHQFAVTFHSWADALPKGAHTFELQLKSDANDDGQVISEKRITVVEF